jgi:hypothetical protein
MKKQKGSQSRKRELRTYTAAQPLTVRTTPDGSKQVAGYAIVWNSPSVDLGGFTEICAPSMLDRTLKENPDVLALRDHKQELLIGRTTAGTLDLKTDSTGLAFVVTLPKTAIGDDTAENVRLRNLTGVSFGFSTVDDSWAADSGGSVVRTLLDIDLFEISVTSFPAYNSSSVNTRSCPVELRKRLKDDLDDDDDDSDDLDDSDDDSDDDDDDDNDECRCMCPACVTDDCVRCTQRDCSDVNCEACPAQDGLRSDRIRIRRLFAHRHAV